MSQFALVPFSVQPKFAELLVIFKAVRLVGAKHEGVTSILISSKEIYHGEIFINPLIPT